ncbi:polysaccharide deacetylase family protein [Alicyclobacillus pomorum]|uniref:polysaccharide deacetylase family protein n=1 Tax=Alicyclobacillus pomorum TaxID=204470 RepID=UPI0004077BDA|nr:polysaccharide deacetylase family protein [Alicyclobacillus pomorum]
MRWVLLTLALLHTGGIVWPWPVIAQSKVTPAYAKMSDLDTVRKAGETYGRSPVDARMDRVWHAIPGLSGWKLDPAASERETQRAKDHRIHLVWQAVQPHVSIRQLPPEPIYKGPKEERSVALMFNVSWGEEFVPGILRTLQEEHVHATFFLDGAWVKKHPELTKEIYAAGHEIGSHGSGHPDFRRLASRALEQQIVVTNTVIHHTLGIDPTLLAPPAGSYDQRTVELAHRHHMYTVLWTADTVDWRRPAPSAIVERIRRHVEPGALILMHPTRPTQQALPTLLEIFRKNGYTCKTVGQVVHEEAVVKPPASLSPKS